MQSLVGRETQGIVYSVNAVMKILDEDGKYID